MQVQRRKFLKNASAISLAMGGLGLQACASPPEYKQAKTIKENELIEADRAQKLYDEALKMARKNHKGGPSSVFFKKPYLDAAFSNELFLWDTCFMASFAKYHLSELAITQALDNFYQVQEEDGFICRMYLENGRPFWEKNHPVSINPPLLAFAELEIFSQSRDKERLIKVYPKLEKFYTFLKDRYQQEDDLFFMDASASGMSNLPRYPKNWVDDGEGMPVKNLYPNIFQYKGLNSKWNQQGRFIDFSSQMALFAANMKEMALLIEQAAAINLWEKEYEAIKSAINQYCWSPEHNFYFDLGYGQQIPRFHIGSYWTLLAGIVPEDRLPAYLDYLTHPEYFGRPTPFPALAAREEEYKGYGDYWLGSSWAPTSYMVLRGLQKYNQYDLAKKLATQLYRTCDKVYEFTGTFWENYAPEAASYGAPAKPDFCGWTALIPIAIYREFIKGS